MEEDTVRVRLVFADRHILSKRQKKEGLEQSWILLKSKHITISDFSSHLINTFNLQNACPRGLILYMDGFVLPPLESTTILKDKDIISVKKKEGALSERIKVNDGLHALEEIDSGMKKHVHRGLKLLTNEVFNENIKSCERDTEGDEPEWGLKKLLDVEDTPVDNNTSSKRKAPTTIQCSKRRKKNRMVSTEFFSKDAEKGVHEGKKGKSSRDRVRTKETPVTKGVSSDKETEDEKSSASEVEEIKNSPIKSTPNTKRSRRHQETGKVSGDVSQMTGETKKLPSRSARRKKAKRQWLRERTKVEKKELHQKQAVVEDGQQSIHSDNPKVSEEHKQLDQQCDADDEIVPIEVRPGHIRFEPLSEVGAKSEDLAAKKKEIVVETFNWNGITNKKKGQKWGKEKTGYSKRNDCWSSSQECSQILDDEVKTANGHMDYDKLAPYSSLPKEEDIIAYRLIELSFSWTPELSSYRIGKISWYNAETNKIKLVPVPEYPLEHKMHDDESELQPEASLYHEDGSLEIEFSSLAEVRIVKHGNSNTATPVVSNTSLAKQDATNSRSNDNKKVHAPTQVNGKVNPWEEISKALSAKKEQLTQEDGWSNKESSGRRSWSHKGLRGGALGPTMALLRAQNGL